MTVIFTSPGSARSRAIETVFHDWKAFPRGDRGRSEWVMDPETWAAIAEPAAENVIFGRPVVIESGAELALRVREES